jgi:LPS export ABC transporter protein LptC
MRLAAGGKEWNMKKLRVLAAVMVAALALLGIWVAGTGPRPDGAAADNADSPDSAYDYEAHDVVVRQMGPDGALQYELEARQISQLPRNGQISAQELVMHHDPAGSLPGGANRWTLTADRAVLPESGTAITLAGDVHAQGRPQNSQEQVVVLAEQVTYDLQTQDVSSDTPVDVTWGRSKFRSTDLRLNIKRGTINVESGSNGTFSP